MTDKIRFRLDKLIRDKIPAIMNAEDIEIAHYVTDREEYISRLNDKLLEEAQEVIAATNKEELCEELGDLFEVIQAIATVNEIPLEEIIEKAKLKNEQKGNFAGRLYSSHISMKHDHPLVKEYKIKLKEVSSDE